MDLQDKVIWITGASSGIGEALAHALAQRGARLILSARNEEKLRAVQASLPNSDCHRVLPLDLSNAEQVHELVTKALSQLGPVDVLINNAGLSHRSFVEETSLKVDRYLMEVNYFGAVAMTKALLPSMLQRSNGAIVTVSSVAGKVGSQSRSAYSAAKHAVIGFMDSLRAEVSKRGINVIVACPGWVNTNISLNALNGKGETENVVDNVTANGISAQQCAEKIIHAMEGGKPEVVIGKGLSRAGPTIKRFFPGFARWLVARKVYR